MDDDDVPEDGDGDGEEEAVHPDEDVDELRQDDAPNQSDVVGHGEDEEVEGEVDKEDGVEDAVDDGVRAEDPVDGCTRTLPSSSIEDPEDANLSGNVLSLFYHQHNFVLRFTILLKWTTFFYV